MAAPPVSVTDRVSHPHPGIVGGSGGSGGGDGGAAAVSRRPTGGDKGGGAGGTGAGVWRRYTAAVWNHETCPVS